MQKTKKTMAYLIGASLLLSVPTLPAFAENEIPAGPILGGSSNIAVPYDDGRGNNGGIPYDGGIAYDGGSPYIPGVPNPDSTESKIKFVDFSDEDKDDKGSSRTVKRGETFKITLKENASTGYQWSFTAKPSMGITFLGTTISEGKSTSQKNAVGTPSQKTWTFLANEAGTYKITFTSSRSGSSAVDQTQVYTIQVK